MSSRLFCELAELASETRQRVHGGAGKQIIEKLTVIVGYGHMVEKNPQFKPLLEKHLESFVDLACTHGYAGLCTESKKILETIRNDGTNFQAAQKNFSAFAGEPLELLK
jgi:hypothetical protein